MGTFQNIGIADYVRRYGYGYALKRGIFMACPLHVVRNYETRKLLYHEKIRRSLEKKYLYAAEKNPEGLEFENIQMDNPVWIYWEQGIEKAPELVKRCVESIRHYSPGTVILLSKENEWDYVRLPEYILERRRQGGLSAATYSDLLRLALLEHYGGTWIDATVFLTGPLPNYVTDSELFAFRDTMGTLYNPALFAVWLLHSKKSQPVIRQTRNILFEYWKREKHLVEYLLFNCVLTLVLEREAQTLRRMPCVSSEYTGLLLKQLGDSWSEPDYFHITGLTEIHKLTYKLKKEVLDQKGTFYDRLIRGDKQAALEE